MKYDVEVTYLTPSYSERKFTLAVEAKNESKARIKARQELYNQPRRKVLSIRAAKVLTPKFLQDFEVGQIIAFNSGARAIIRAKFFDKRNRAQFSVEDVNTDRIGVFTLEEMIKKTEPKITVEYYAIYPDGNCYKSDRPVQSSTYGVENLIQVKSTKRNGKIINKEIV